MQACLFRIVFRLYYDDYIIINELNQLSARRYSLTSRCLDTCALLACNFNSASCAQLNIGVESISTACIRSRKIIHNYKLQISLSTRVRKLLLWFRVGRWDMYYGASTTNILSSSYILLGFIKSKPIL